MLYAGFGALCKMKSTKLLGLLHYSGSSRTHRPFLRMPSGVTFRKHTRSTRPLTEPFHGTPCSQELSILSWFARPPQPQPTSQPYFHRLSSDILAKPNYPWPLYIWLWPPSVPVSTLPSLECPPASKSICLPEMSHPSKSGAGSAPPGGRPASPLLGTLRSHFSSSKLPLPWPAFP